MPSARARVVNAAYRVYVRPTMRRGGDVESLRRRLDRLTPLAGRTPAGTVVQSVDHGPFESEMISAEGSDPRRRVLYFHGGGFVARSPALHRAFVARLSQETRISAMLAFYRLAPEHPFPAAVEDCLAAYEYLLDAGFESSDIVVGGESAGGCLALATLFALRDEGRPMPAGAFMLSPVTDLRGHRSGSRTSNSRSDSMLTMDVAEELHSHYVKGREAELSNPLVSPLLGDFDGLPPLLFHTSGAEILRDDSVLAAQRARAAGVECELEVYPGMPHAWHVIPNLPESRRALADVGGFVRRCVADARHQREEQQCITPT